MSGNLSQSAVGQLQRQITAIWKEINRGHPEHPPWQRGCRVYRDSTQSIAHNTLVPLSFSTEVYDTDSCWSVGDPTKLYATHAGYYMAGGQINFQPGVMSQAADIGVFIRANGTTYLAAQQAYCVASHEVSWSVVAGMFWLGAGEYVEIVTRQIQNSGSNAINLTAASSALQSANNGWIARIA